MYKAKQGQNLGGGGNRQVIGEFCLSGQGKNHIQHLSFPWKGMHMFNWLHRGKLRTHNTKVSPAPSLRAVP